MKIKCFEKWSKFQHGIGYWLGAVQATNHCLNQCWHSSSTHIYVSQCDWIEYYATLWSWWSHNNRNGYVVEVATRVVTGGAEACLQRLRWWLGRSSWRHIRFIDEIAMDSYLLYTVFNTLRPRQDGCLFADDILKCIFLNGNSWIPNKISWEYVALRLIDNKPSMVQIMGCRRAGDNPIIWTNDGTVYWRIYEIRPRWVKGRWPRRSFWRHIRFSDYIAIVFVFTVYCVLGT